MRGAGRVSEQSAGSAALPNDGGIDLQGAASNNTVAGNLVSGNTLTGIDVESGGNLVEGDLVGTNAAGTAAVPNSFGIQIFQAGDDTVGGKAAGAGNVVAFSGDDGVLVGGTAGVIPAAGRNAVLGNSIFGNAKLGIDLGPAGVTANGSAGAAPRADRRSRLRRGSPRNGHPARRRRRDLPD